MTAPMRMSCCGSPGRPAYAWRPSRKRLRYVTMAEIALRVRLIGGDHVDVTYSDGDAAADKLVQNVISTLAEDGGALRCKHGDRLIVLYGRGVATVEVAPRGAIL
jgi:hypothetical protein